ncbi:hypothetical protein HAX54_008086, partial [Datura stramonium]|nr:hypothetical protein [Datura stramonium]
FKDKGDKVDELADKLRKSNGERDISLYWMICGMKLIIVTTDLKAGEHVKRHTDLYFLPFLPLDESGKLLQKKVFQKEDCPPELQDVHDIVLHFAWRRAEEVYADSEIHTTFHLKRKSVSFSSSNKLLEIALWGSKIQKPFTPTLEGTHIESCSSLGLQWSISIKRQIFQSKEWCLRDITFHKHK